MKATLSSFPILSNYKTKVVYFIIIPLINIILTSIIAYQFNSDFSYDIAINSILISGAIQSLLCVSSSFVYDRHMGIDRIIISNNPFSLYYWITKFVSSFMIGFILIIINLLFIYIVSIGKVNILSPILITPFILFSAIIVGLVSAVASWRLKNPYFWSNIFASFAYVFSGVLISYYAYPPLLKPFTYIFPFAHTLDFIRTDVFSLTYDMFLNLLWIVVGLIVFIIQIKIIRKNNSFSIL